jgi:hypothetical protein
VRDVCSMSDRQVSTGLNRLHSLSCTVPHAQSLMHSLSCTVSHAQSLMHSPSCKREALRRGLGMPPWTCLLRSPGAVSKSLHGLNAGAGARPHADTSVCDRQIQPGCALARGGPTSRACCSCTPAGGGSGGARRWKRSSSYPEQQVREGEHSRALQAGLHGWHSVAMHCLVWEDERQGVVLRQRTVLGSAGM